MTLDLSGAECSSSRSQDPLQCFVAVLKAYQFDEGLDRFLPLAQREVAPSDRWWLGTVGSVFGYAMVVSANSDNAS